jgi:hypothetical protein
MRFPQFERSSLLYRGGWNPAQVAFVVSIIVTIISSLFGPRQGSRFVDALSRSVASCRSPICLPYHYCGMVSVWGGRLASQRDVAFGKNFIRGISEYNRIPNLLNEGGCRDNQLFAPKSPVITETFGTGTQEFLFAGGKSPSGQLGRINYRVRHTDIIGKPGISVVSPSGMLCSGLKSDCLSGSPPYGGMLLWHEYLTRGVSMTAKGYTPWQTHKPDTSLETYRESSMQLHQCSRAFVPPPKGQARNKSLASAPEGTVHNEHTVLKGCSSPVEPPFVTLGVLIFECNTSYSLLRTSGDPWGLIPREFLWYIPEVWRKKECVGPQRHPTGMTFLFRRQLSCRLLMVDQPDRIARWFSNRGTGCSSGFSRSTPKSPVVVVFVD